MFVLYAFTLRIVRGSAHLIIYMNSVDRVIDSRVRYDVKIEYAKIVGGKSGEKISNGWMESFSDSLLVVMP